MVVGTTQTHFIEKNLSEPDTWCNGQERLFSLNFINYNIEQFSPGISLFTIEVLFWLTGKATQLGSKKLSTE